MEMIVVELASKDAIVASLDAKLASKDASLHDELLSTNAMVDSMTQEMEKLGVELVSKNAIIASLDAKLESMNDELLLKKIMIDRFKAIITRETELLLERGKGIPSLLLYNRLRLRSLDMSPCLIEHIVTDRQLHDLHLPSQLSLHLLKAIKFMTTHEAPLHTAKNCLKSAVVFNQFCGTEKTTTHFSPSLCD
jgi:hypothetical protein